MPLTDLIPWKREKSIPVKQSSGRELEHPLNTFQRDVNRLFDEFFNREFNLTPFEGFGFGETSFSPKLDMKEDAKSVTLSAELPGLNEEDVEITLLDTYLTISGEKKTESETQDTNYYRIERSYGKFQRAVNLPCEVVGDQADASFKNGILTITLPKAKPGPDKKKITIK